tara:strand:+ start:551 stop:835 length:285 start_codon:yes stop_codon:yes gene_type:complete
MYLITIEDKKEFIEYSFDNHDNFISAVKEAEKNKMKYSIKIDYEKIELKNIKDIISLLIGKNVTKQLHSKKEATEYLEAFFCFSTIYNFLIPTE